MGDRINKFDIAIVGASLGGTIAVYQACNEGKNVILIEETDWIGGQLTIQAVPPDEHPWIEEQGCTKTYRRLRNEIRRHYNDNKNPGNGWVSRITHQPIVAKNILDNWLKEFIETGRLEIRYNSQVIDCSINEFESESNNEIHCITIQDKITGASQVVEAKFYLDATDQGDLFPIVGEDYNLGSDGKRFNEVLGDDKVDRKDIQPITWVACLAKTEYEQKPIDKPKDYDRFRQVILDTPKEQVFNQLSWYGPDSTTKGICQFKMYDSEQSPYPALWSYRRIYDPDNLGTNGNEQSLINWPQNDYVYGNIIEDEHADINLEQAKNLTLSLIYWLQTEADRPDGGKGYNNLRLSGQSIGTIDGLAKAPYIREGRRLDSAFIVKEQDLKAKTDNQKVARFDDTIGVGYYHMDLHMTTQSKRFMYDKCLPFEIPLGIMISKKFTNCIPASKNVGTTHITNSCFRVHPCEWNIGEVAGLLAVYCMDNGLTIQQLYEDKDSIKAFQEFIEKRGIQLHWKM